MDGMSWIALFGVLTLGAAVLIGRAGTTKMTPPENSDDRHTENPYATPPEKFMVWPADQTARAAPSRASGRLACATGGNLPPSEYPNLCSLGGGRFLNKKL